MLKKVNSVFSIILLVLIVYFLFIKSTKLEFVQKFPINNLPTVCGDIKLGGFSDLYFKDGYLYAITDRGPNSDDFIKDGKTFRNFLCENYTTYLVKFKLENNEARIVETLPIKELSGIPIASEKDSTPLDKNGKSLSFNINGADIESFIIDKDGNYWLGDEYYPSIIKLDKNLKVIKRFAPKNSEIKNPKITYILPEKFNKVRKNLGFESMAYDGNENIFVFTQAGLQDESNISIIKFNIKMETVEEVFEYNFFDNSIMSAATFVDENKFYVAERLYDKHFINEISLKNGIFKSTGILRTLTSSDKITKNMKIEGLAKNGENIYIINDNDFGIDPENIKDSFIMQFKLKK